VGRAGAPERRCAGRRTERGVSRAVR
jgi:hypothetical protein